MVIGLQSLDNEIEIFFDSTQSIFLIIQHLYKVIYWKILTENKLKLILQNGIINTLQTRKIKI